MAKSSNLYVCHPYDVSVSVTCICDRNGGRRVILRCLEGLQSDDLNGEAMLSRDDRANDGLGSPEDLLDGLSGPNRGLDERTEIILAATFLVLIILAFIRYGCIVVPKVTMFLMEM